MRKGPRLRAAALWAYVSLRCGGMSAPRESLDFGEGGERRYRAAFCDAQSRDRVREGEVGLDSFFCEEERLGHA